MDIKNMTKEQLAEESIIDIAYEVLKEHGEHLTLRQLMDEVRKLNGITVRAMANKLARVNTDINIDGRFLAIDDIRWGLREWFPVDQLEAESAPVVRARRKKKSTDDDDDDDFELDEIDEDGFDKIDIDDEEDDDDEDEIMDDYDEDEEDIDVDLLDEDDEEDIPDDLLIDDEDDEELEEDDY